MKVTVQSAAGALDMELSEDMDMGTVGVLVQCELGGADVKLSSLGCVLADPAVTLGGLGFLDGEVIYAGNPPPDPWRQKWIEEMSSIKQNPYQLSIYKQNHPPLATAVERDDIDAFSQIVADSERSKRKRQADERVHRMTLANDPFNVEAQRALESEIQLDNVEQLRQQAVEHMPESFAGGSITMLYINVIVNGIPLKAFVDSGAQMTIMSSQCAERCGMMRLVDTRFQGMAVGVGTQKIIGRVHMAQVQIEETFLPTSFSILENQPMDMLLGLDMLKRHRCLIDLQENVLRIGTTNTTTRFLPESEIPKKDDLTAPSDPSDPSAPAQAGAGGASFPEEAIQNLMSMGGFSREQVVGALNAAQGDPEVAAGFLLGS